MVFKTETSIYELKKEDGKFRITKLAILPGFSSRIQPGESFVGTEIKITSTNLILMNEHGVTELQTTLPEF